MEDRYTVYGVQEVMVETPSEERYWSRFALSYDRDGEYVVGRSILEAILNRLSEEQDLGNSLELGCGTGYFTRTLAGQARQLIATDLSDEMLQVARVQLSRFQNVTIQKADCASTDFPAEAFDSVVMTNLLHVLKDPSACLLESYRILKRGGLLIAVDFTGYRLSFPAKARLGWRYVRKWGIPPRHGQNNLSPEDLASIVKDAGFTIKDVEILAGGSNALYLRGIKPAVQ